MGMKWLLAITAWLIVLVPTETLAQNAGSPGSSQCGWTQKLIQQTVGDESPNVYRNHGDYVSTAAKIASQALEAGLITKGCSDCIVDQFAGRVPIASQKQCGPVTSPTQSCTQTTPTPAQIQTAVVLALAKLTNPWGDITQFQTLLNSAQGILGCQIWQNGATATAIPLLPQAPAAAQGCATSGVDYCGPGTSQRGTAVATPAYLNEACCNHDTCYGVNCVSTGCYWTPQSQSCDNTLVAVCRAGGGSNLSLLERIEAQAVCTIVECLNDGIGAFLTLPFNLAATCAAQRVARVALNSQCNQPPSLQTCNLQCVGQTCGNFSTCNPGSGCIAPVCGSLAEGGGLCVEGTTACAGLSGCTTSADCGGGLCFVGSCCGRNVCVPSGAFCPDIGAPHTSMSSAAQVLQSLPGTTISCLVP